jgi:hypothetical protein
MVKYKISTMIERLSAILTKIEIFVLFNFFFSSVNKRGYFNDAISLLWWREGADDKKPYVLPVITPRCIEAL